MASIPNNNAVREALNSMHQCVVRTFRGGTTDSQVIEDGRLFRLVCENPDLDPAHYAAEMARRYGYDIRGGRVLRTLRFYSLSTPEKREELCAWATKVADLFLQCLKTRKRLDFKRLKEEQEAIPLLGGDDKQVRSLNRVLCLMLYMRSPELNAHDDLEKLEHFAWPGETAERRRLFHLRKREDI